MQPRINLCKFTIVVVIRVMLQFIAKFCIRDIFRAEGGPTDLFSGSVRSIIVTSDGVLFFETPGIIKTICLVDMLKFPFDKQTCKFIFATQNMPSNLVSVKVIPFF